MDETFDELLNKLKPLYSFGIEIKENRLKGEISLIGKGGWVGISKVIKYLDRNKIEFLEANTIEPRSDGSDYWEILLRAKEPKL